MSKEKKTPSPRRQIHVVVIWEYPQADKIHSAYTSRRKAAGAVRRIKNNTHYNAAYSTCDLYDEEEDTEYC